MSGHGAQRLLPLRAVAGIDEVVEDDVGGLLEVGRRRERAADQKMTSPDLRRARNVLIASSRMSFASASERRSFT